MTETPGPGEIRLRHLAAEEVRAQLARKRVSATQLARHLGVSQPYVWRRLNGETAFDLDDLERIANTLGVSVLDLLPAQAGAKGAQKATVTLLTGFEQVAQSNRPSSYPSASTRPGGSRRPRQLRHVTDVA